MAPSPTPGVGVPGLRPALDAHYKVFRYKAYEGETYDITSPDNIRVKLGDTLAFFDQYLKDGMQTAPSALPPTTPVAVSRAGAGAP